MLCLEQWRAVTLGCNDRSWVLESCALQSTVRFMPVTADIVEWLELPVAASR